MAIKGKKKKSGPGRPKVHAPRRDPLPPKPAALKRRWVQLTIMGIVAFVCGLAVSLTTVNPAAPDSSGQVTTEQRASVAKLAHSVDPILKPLGGVPKSGSSVPDGFYLFPDLPGALKNMQDGTLTRAKFRQQVDGVVKQADEGATALQGLPMGTLAQPLPTARADIMFTAQSDMFHGLQAYARMADILSTVADLPSAARAKVIAKTEQALSNAEGLFNAGFKSYKDLVNWSNGVSPSPAPSLPPGVHTGAPPFDIPPIPSTSPVGGAAGP